MERDERCGGNRRRWCVVAAAGEIDSMIERRRSGLSALELPWWFGCEIVMDVHSGSGCSK
jgi:hypothetical protein